MQPPTTRKSRVVLLSQKDIALSQLNRAVALFLDEKDFVSCVTLACASEEIFGKHLEEIGIRSHSFELKSSLQKLSPDLTPKQINDEYVNRARNFFKHKQQDIDALVEFDSETEAICALVRATSNAALTTQSLSEPLIKFLQWLKTNRPDLTNTDEIEKALDR